MSSLFPVELSITKGLTAQIPLTNISVPGETRFGSIFHVRRQAQKDHICYQGPIFPAIVVNRVSAFPLDCTDVLSNMAVIIRNLDVPGIHDKYWPVLQALLESPFTSYVTIDKEKAKLRRADAFVFRALKEDGSVEKDYPIAPMIKSIKDILKDIQDYEPKSSQQDGYAVFFKEGGKTATNSLFFPTYTSYTVANRDSIAADKTFTGAVELKPANYPADWLTSTTIFSSMRQPWRVFARGLDPFSWAFKWVVASLALTAQKLVIAMLQSDMIYWRMSRAGEEKGRVGNGEGNNINSLHGLFSLSLADQIAALDAEFLTDRQMDHIDLKMYDIVFAIWWMKNMFSTSKCIVHPYDLIINNPDLLFPINGMQSYIFKILEPVEGADWYNSYFAALYRDLKAIIDEVMGMLKALRVDFRIQTGGGLDFINALNSNNLGGATHIDVDGTQIQWASPLFGKDLQYFGEGHGELWLTTYNKNYLDRYKTDSSKRTYFDNEWRKEPSMQFQAVDSFLVSEWTKDIEVKDGVKFYSPSLLGKEGNYILMTIEGKNCSIPIDKLTEIKAFKGSSYPYSYGSVTLG